MLITKLGDAAAAADTEAEALERRLADGSLEPDEFVAAYKASRAAFHRLDLLHQAARHTIPH